jgi:hypothetical protein
MPPSRPLASLATVLALVCALAVAPPPARAQERDYFAPTDPEMQLVPRSRPRRQTIWLASLAGGAVAIGGVGVLFHLDSRDKSDQVSAHSGERTGRVYTPEVDDVRRGALRSRKIAIGAYAFGGALLVGTAIAFMVTDPGDELVRVDGGPRPVVVPVSGGAMLGAQGRF